MNGRTIPEGKINKMKRQKFVALCEYLYKNVFSGNMDKVVSFLYASETFKCLQDTETDFWWKSDAELKYLIQKELDGDWKAWEKQGF